MPVICLVKYLNTVHSLTKAATSLRLSNDLDFCYQSMTIISISVTVEDLERNDGSAEKPYYMSKSLQKLLNKENRGSKDAVDAGSDADK